MSAGQTYTFHRLFGDINGDGTVDNSDYTVFEADYSSTRYGPTYDPAFDPDGEHRDFNTAYRAFLSDYGTTYTYTPSGSIFADTSTTPPLGATDVSSWSVGANDMYYSGSNVIEERQAGSSGAWREQRRGTLRTLLLTGKAKGVSGSVVVLTYAASGSTPHAWQNRQGWTR